MYADAIWGLVEQAYAHLELSFPGRREARSQVVLRFEDPCIGYDQLDVMFPSRETTVRFTGGKNPTTMVMPPAKDIILAIDDNPERYTMLARQVQTEGWVVVYADTPSMVRVILGTYRDRVLAVMLDHDMPGWTGKEAAERFLAQRSIPVIITTNNDGGGKQIASVLDEWAVPYHFASAMGTFKEEHWISILREWSADTP